MYFKSNTLDNENAIHAMMCLCLKKYIFIYIYVYMSVKISSLLSIMHSCVDETT